MDSKEVLLNLVPGNLLNDSAVGTGQSAFVRFVLIGTQSTHCTTSAATARQYLLSRTYALRTA